MEPSKESCYPGQREVSAVKAFGRYDVSPLGQPANPVFRNRNSPANYAPQVTSNKVFNTSGAGIDPLTSAASMQNNDAEARCRTSMQNLNAKPQCKTSMQNNDIAPANAGIASIA